ncbi:MAG TPA: hypothetical protein VFD38_09780 [Myxococcaceae bacterium]|nr:hypothetical protein [Myxococcaceae bacterium]
MIRPGWAPLLTVLSLVAACAGAPPAPEALCQARRPADAPAEVLPEEWAALLLHGYDPRTQTLTGAALDCTGAPVAWSEVDDACAVREEAPPKPLPRRGPPPAVVATLSERERLVWIPLLGTPDGDALGPLARIRVDPGVLAVVAVGTARSAAGRGSLRLERLGGVDVALVEGQRCQGAVCQRPVRLVPQRGRRFIGEPFTTLAGACAGPAIVWAHRQLERSAGPGVTRVYELDSTLSAGPAALAVHEQLSIRERDPQAQGGAGKVVRRAQDDRSITFDGGRMRVDRPSLWTRLEEFLR